MGCIYNDWNGKCGIKIIINLAVMSNYRICIVDDDPNPEDSCIDYESADTDYITWQNYNIMV